MPRKEPRPIFVYGLATVVTALAGAWWLLIPSYVANFVVIADTPLTEFVLEVDGRSVPVQSIRSLEQTIYFSLGIQQDHVEAQITIRVYQSGEKLFEFDEYIHNKEITNCTYIFRIDRNGS